MASITFSNPTEYIVEATRVVVKYTLTLVGLTSGTVEVTLSNTAGGSAKYEARFDYLTTPTTTKNFTSGSPTADVFVYLTSPIASTPAETIRATGGIGGTPDFNGVFGDLTTHTRVGDLTDDSGTIKYQGIDTTNTLIGFVGTAEYLIVKNFTDVYTTQRSNVESLYYFVDNTSNVLNKIVTTRVTDMNKLFYIINNDQSIASWDTSNVTDMDQMFLNSDFNHPLNSWDVSKVENFSSMFFGATTFDQPLNNWDTSSATTISNMFREASAFNQNIDSWDVSNVENMNFVFFNAIAFNKPLNSWNVSNVTSMSDMFRGTSDFDQNLSNWNVSLVENMQNMFNSSKFNKPIGDWNVSNVTNMLGMFEGNTFFNQPLNTWDVSKVTSMAAMFRNASDFNQPLANWNVHLVTNMNLMFEGATLFNQDIGNWDVGNVTMMNSMFQNAGDFNQDLSHWDVRNIPIEPTDFKTGANATWIANAGYQPRWGDYIPPQNNVIFGNGPPTNDTTGEDGNLYIDLQNRLFYGPRVEGVWPAAVPITPPSTPVTGTWISGIGAPADTLGENGLFYIDTTTGETYGPKASGSWPALPHAEQVSTTGLTVGLIVVGIVAGIAVLAVIGLFLFMMLR